MPVVQIELFGNKTLDQKRVLVDKVTQAIADSLNYPTDCITIILREMKKDEYALGGKLYIDDPKY
ncbi:MAG: 2-hydroxymuconate tautomerase family protein [Clostridiales Family XIII bacterium]|jgi:4-oxalocrotonate tautomerase|nr:2-hydroxymuconate tautomerase family protein [Clostridiales Family XIII bacterium]